MVGPSLLPLWEKVAEPKARSDEGCWKKRDASERGAERWIHSHFSTTALRPTPLIRLGAPRRSTFSHKGRRGESRLERRALRLAHGGSERSSQRNSRFTLSERYSGGSTLTHDRDRAKRLSPEATRPWVARRSARRRRSECRRGETSSRQRAARPVSSPR
jgi:hypothetical protein